MPTKKGSSKQNVGKNKFNTQLTKDNHPVGNRAHPSIKPKITGKAKGK
jgi:hypothetical protein